MLVILESETVSVEHDEVPTGMLASQECAILLVLMFLYPMQEKNDNFSFQFLFWEAS